MILGSVNVNDRSQNGDRDSELVILVMDDAERETVTLRDRPSQVHKVVRKMRMDLWKKHFALGGANGLVQPASDMSALIERPAAEATIAKIKDLAATNAELYRQVFPHVPWSGTDPKNPSGASLWPVCPKGTTALQALTLATQMPFHDDYWATNGPTARSPSGVRGHFVQLPIFWTLGENNHPTKMSVMAVAGLDQKVHSPVDPTQRVSST